MNKIYSFLSAFLAFFMLSGCGNNPVSGSNQAASTSPLATQLTTAQLVRSWDQPSGSTLLVTTAGAFNLSMAGCNVTGTISSIDSYPQSQCLQGVATCGIVYLTVLPATSCHGFTAGTPGVCSYQTVAEALVINCDGQTADTMTFQWQ